MISTLIVSGGAIFNAPHPLSFTTEIPLSSWHEQRQRQRERQRRQMSKCIRGIRLERMWLH